MITAATALLLASATLGHLGEDQYGRFPFLDEAGGFIGGQTSWGIITPDARLGGFQRVCEESFGPVVFSPRTSGLHRGARRSVCCSPASMGSR